MNILNRMWYRWRGWRERGQWVTQPGVVAVGKRAYYQCPCTAKDCVCRTLTDIPVDGRVAAVNVQWDCIYSMCSMAIHLRIGVERKTDTAKRTGNHAIGLR